VAGGQAGEEAVDLPAMRAKADELMAQFERMRSGLGDLQQKLKAVAATVTSDDGLVTATVGPRGQVVKVEFDPRIYRRPNSKELSATVTETIRKATAKAMAEVEELTRPFVPDAQFQAYMDHDLEGIFRQLDSELPGGEDR
jgi:DNA-binding protein YbaB